MNEARLPHGRDMRNAVDTAQEHELTSTMKTKRFVTTDFQRTQRTQELNNEEAGEAQAREQAKKNHDFVQFQRAGMTQFIGLIRRSPAAAQALIQLATLMGRTNDIGSPMQSLQIACGTSRATMSRAIKLLIDERWLRVVLIGTTRTFQLNSNVFWSAARDLKQFPDVFTARIKATPSSIEDQNAETITRAKRIPILTTTQKKVPTRSKQGTQQDV